LLNCGEVINPLLLESQIQDGVAHGIGNASVEYMRYDEVGNPETTTLEEYLLPALLDIAKVDIVHLESPSPLNPIRVKGTGESGTILAAAAIVAAIEDALSSIRIRINEASLTADTSSTSLCID
jgi:aerobic carbon-monoxide dehydrogenase large subunit